MAVANNITRLLDSRKIAYQVFELPEEKFGTLQTARLLGVEAELVYKTIVINRVKGNPILVVISAPNRVDLKRLVAALGEKKVILPSEREAEKLTGLQAGGISPLALLNKSFQVVIDSAAQSKSEIHVSGGQRGLNIRLSVKGLAEITRARFAAVSEPDPEEEESDSTK